MYEVPLIVRAFHRDYIRCPVSVVLPAGRLPDGPLAVLDEADGSVHPAQAMRRADGSHEVIWILPRIAAGEERRCLLHGTEQAPRNPVTLAKREGRVEVRLRGVLLTAYRFGEEWARPFLHPLNGPTGRCVTRRFPMEEVPGETRDHKHHKGCWVAWGDVNGADDWSEAEGHARIVHRRFEALESGPVFGRLVALNDWTTAAGARLMEEQREYLFYALPGRERAFDQRVTFRATDGPVRFGDTKEGGICSVRVATSMDADKGGRIENAFGGLYERETWGRRAHWCDYSGPVEGETLGIAIMDHPDNLRHPTYWHVRNYGLMTANPFGLSHFHRDKSRDGSHTLPAGGELAFRYRVLLHRGDAAKGRVAERYHHYVNPPEVRVAET